MTPSTQVRVRLNPLIEGTCPHCGQPIGDGEGLTVAEIARASGVKRHVIARLMRGETILTSNLDRLSAWLDDAKK